MAPTVWITCTVTCAPNGSEFLARLSEGWIQSSHAPTAQGQVDYHLRKEVPACAYCKTLPLPAGASNCGDAACVEREAESNRFFSEAMEQSHRDARDRNEREGWNSIAGPD